MTSQYETINETSFWFKDKLLPLLAENSFEMNLRCSYNQIQFEDDNERFGLHEDEPTFEMNSDLQENSIDRLSIASACKNDVAQFLKDVPNNFDVG